MGASAWTTSTFVNTGAPSSSNTARPDERDGLLVIAPRQSVIRDNRVASVSSGRSPSPLSRISSSSRRAWART